MQRFAITIMLLLFLSLTLLTACSDESTSYSFLKSELPVIYFQEFNIPQFPTAQGQLNYAKSGFASSKEKKAALEILFKIFPEDRLQCGNAALFLAYMNLGYDYRFATRQDYTNAIKAYNDIILKYDDYPQILVKANWYLGWIYCDLLKETKAGVPKFWNIVNTWPDIKMGISSPVPWVSLVYPLTIKSSQPTKNTTSKQWASVALLEIIRHASEETEVFKAFDILWNDYQNSVSTGLAIKLLLYDKRYAQKVIPYSEQYLALNITNKYLTKEIRDKSKEY